MSAVAMPQILLTPARKKQFASGEPRDRLRIALGCGWVECGVREVKKQRMKKSRTILLGCFLIAVGLLFTGCGMIGREDGIPQSDPERVHRLPP
jgi:hypothetical protein